MSKENKAVAVDEKPSNLKPLIDFKSAKVLSKHLKENEFTYEWLNTRFDAEAVVDGNTTTFDVALRAKKDSALWMSISKLGIEVARVFITRDSVKFVDRFNNKYFKGDYTYLSNLMHTDLDFDMMQSLLIGNSVEFYEEDEKLNSKIDSSYFLLSTIRKRKIKKVIQQNNPKDELVQRIWIEPKRYKIARLLINDFKTSRTFEAIYMNYQMVDSLKFPFNVNFDITASKKVNIKINYSKVTRNKEQTFPFSIPERYNAIDQPAQEKP